MESGLEKVMEQVKRAKEAGAKVSLRGDRPKDGNKERTFYEFNDIENTRK